VHGRLDHDQDLVAKCVVHLAVQAQLDDAAVLWMPRSVRAGAGEDLLVTGFALTSVLDGLLGYFRYLEVRDPRGYREIISIAMAMWKSLLCEIEENEVISAIFM
jgi:hypothetical protein